MAGTKFDNVITVEDALSLTGFGPFNYLVILFTGLISNNVVLESLGISFALPILECDLNLTFQQQGVLGAVSFVGVIISSHFWGFLADTTGRKRIMQPALLVGFIITIISSFSPNFETLAIMRFLSGIFLSAGSGTVYAYLGEFHCAKYRNRAILGAAFISAITAILFPITAWFFINQSWHFRVPFTNLIYKPWRSYIIACGMPGFICGIILLFLPESPKFLLTNGHIDKSVRIIKDIHKWNRVKDTEDKIQQITALQPDSEDKIKSNVTNPSKNRLHSLFFLIWEQTAPLFMRQHIRKTFLASIIQFFIFFTAHGIYVWFPYILNSVMQYTQNDNYSPACLCNILDFTRSSDFTFNGLSNATCVTKLEISTYQHTIVLELVYIGLLASVSYFIGKLGRLRMLFIILVTTGTFGILGLIIKIPLVAVYFYVIYLCCGLGVTVVTAIIVDIYPTNLRAMAVCISLMIGRIGSVAGSNILGSLIATDCFVTLICSACTLIFAGCLGLLLPQSQGENIKTTTNF